MRQASRTRPAGVRAGETLDRVCGALDIIQAREGYRFGMEALFLCGFVAGRAECALDLGTGCGVIPLVLLWCGKVQRATGIELQGAMCGRARRSATRNGWARNFKVIEGDIRTLPAGLPAGSFDLVTANPPFFEVGRGRTCPHPERTLAREERNGRLEDFVSASRRMLAPRGRLALVFTPRRLEQALHACRSEGLSPTRLRFVYPRADLPPRHVLLEARLATRSALDIEAPFFIEDAAGHKTDEYQAWMYPPAGRLAQSPPRPPVRGVRAPSPG